MGVYIPNIDKVHSRACYRIDGKAEYPLYIHEYHNANHDFLLWSATTEDYTVIPIPAHGRLIDADKLFKVIEEHITNWGDEYKIQDVLDDVAAATTIIESED